jgi:hypothetical protein
MGFPPPDPEVAAKPSRRQFTAAYRLRVLEEADRCTEIRWLIFPRDFGHGGRSTLEVIEI